MKRILVLMLCTVFAFATVSAQESKKKDKKVTTTFLIENMHCENCVKKIEKNIAFEKGVTDLQCDLSTLTAKVTYRSDKTTEQKLITAFEKIDMKAKALKEGEKPEIKHNGHTH